MRSRLPRDVAFAPPGCTPSRAISKRTSATAIFRLVSLRSAKRVSDSYIRKLFEGDGTSFSQFVLGRRLMRAHRMLTDRRWADRSIAWIAFEVGFGDLSYFNRTFKRFYGNTPSDVRGAIIASS